MWDVLDARGQPTGRQVARIDDGGDPAGGLHFGESHRVVMVGVFRTTDNNGVQLLIQHRSPTKITWPSVWDITAGGSVLAGETSQDGAMRELREEVGMVADLSHTRPALTVSATKTVYDIYLVGVPAGLDIDQLTFQADEVDEVMWADRETILEMITDGRFVAIKPSLVDFVFALYDRPGLQTRSYFLDLDE